MSQNQLHKIQMYTELDQWISSLSNKGFSIKREVDIMLSPTQDTQYELLQVGLSPQLGRDFSLQDSISLREEQEGLSMLQARIILAEQTKNKLEKQRQEYFQSYRQRQANQNQQKHKKIKKIQKKEYPKAEIDYKKNIPNYITKTCLNYMFSPVNKKRVEKLCQRQGVQIERLKKQMQDLSEKKMIGLGNLRQRLISDLGVNRVFKSFFTWFSRKRYMIFMLQKGKMLNQDKYISRKNELLYLDLIDSQQNSESKY